MTTTKINRNSIAALILGLGLLTTPAWAASDYGSMSNDELNAMRGTMREASEENRASFRNEWQKRVQSMSQEQRRENAGPPENAKRDGEGNKFRQNQGQGQGQGTQAGQGR